MSIQISDDLIQSSGLTEHELKIELAIALFEKDRLTLAQVSRLAEMPQIVLQRELGRRKIPLHYSLDDLYQDVQNLHLAGKN